MLSLFHSSFLVFFLLSSSLSSSPSPSPSSSFSSSCTFSFLPSFSSSYTFSFLLLSSSLLPSFYLFYFFFSSFLFFHPLRCLAISLLACSSILAPFRFRICPFLTYSLTHKKHPRFEKFSANSSRLSFLLLFLFFSSVFLYFSFASLLFLSFLFSFSISLSFTPPLPLSLVSSPYSNTFTLIPPFLPLSPPPPAVINALDPSSSLILLSLTCPFL